MSFHTQDGKMEIATCGRCDFQLTVMDGNGEVTIRIRDQYIYAKGGYLRIICRGCGTTNILIDNDYEIEHADESKKLRQSSGTIQAKIRKWQERPWFDRKKQQQNKGA